MDFNRVVADMVENVPGGIAGVLMANDGISVAEYLKAGEDLDIHSLGVEYTHILKEIKTASDLLEAGLLDEVTISTSSVIVILRLINDEYLIALVISSDGNAGRARYMLRLISSDLSEEF